MLLRENQEPSLASPSLQPVLRSTRKGPFFQAFVPAGFEFNQYDLPIPSLPTALVNLKIIHISDMHFVGYWSRQYDRAIQLINESQPDLVLFTGDFNEHKNHFRPALKTIERFTRPIQARYGKFGILGNHDGDLIAPYIQAMGVNLLENKVASIPVGSSTIEIIGIAGTDRGDFNMRFMQQYDQRLPNSVRIVLSHYPDHIKRIPFLNADMLLAGHTHGGQICLPGGRPLLTHDTLPKQMCKGVHRYNNAWLIVSKGFGFTTIPVRFFCPSEIAEFRLVCS